MNTELITKEDLDVASGFINQSLEALNKILLGHEAVHKLVIIGIISRGHILLEGLPGVGKTAMIKAIGDIMNLSFNRVQFTPDLMPADILGTNILQEQENGKRAMEFQKGPVFTNIMLADEINRASPKTQSALLEAMQEGSVTLLGKTRELPKPFFVLASQNPIELEGTFPIPEAQLDRFLFKLNIKGVDSNALSDIISNRRRGETPEADFHLTEDNLNFIFDTMNKIYLPKAISNYIARLVTATHPDENQIDEVKDFVSFGASPRAAIAIAEAARATALIANRPTVGFEDVNMVVQPVLNHRMILNYKAKMENMSVDDIINIVLERTEEVDLNLPKDIVVN